MSKYKFENILQTDDIVTIGISDKECILVKLLEDKYRIKYPTFVSTSIPSKYYKVSAKIIPSSENNSEWFLRWARSYSESITGRMSSPMFTDRVYMQNAEYFYKPSYCSLVDVNFETFDEINIAGTEIGLKFDKTNNLFDENALAEKGKELSFLLRHDKDYQFDEHGYREVVDLIDNHDYSKELLEAIAITNDKQRYEFSEDKTKIRARQGHSIDVDVELKECTPPDILYHGTAIRFIDNIENEGIKKMSRQYVHLSKDKETAFNVGKRHGRPCVVVIDVKRMREDGIKFYLSNNDVWLTKFVDKKYIDEIISNAKA